MFHSYLFFQYEIYLADVDHTTYNSFDSTNNFEYFWAKFILIYKKLLC